MKKITLGSLERILMGYDKYNKKKTLTVRTCCTGTKYGSYSLLYYLNIDHDGTLHMNDYKIRNNQITLAFCAGNRLDSKYPVTDKQLDMMYKIVELINKLGIKMKLTLFHQFNNNRG